MATETIGELEHLILLAILRLGSTAYGVTITEEISRHTSRPVLRPSIYVALRRLKSKGLISERLGEPEPRRGGRARRFFELEEGALKILRESRSTFLSLWDGLASELDTPR